MRITTIAVASLLAACSSVANAPASSVACPAMEAKGTPNQATIELAKGGAIVIRLRADKAPNTVATFAKKAQACFYDGLVFHRVVPNFVAQGGDPLGTGTGGGTQPTELSDLPFVKGAVGIARGGDVKVSNDSQFFVVTGDARHLDGQYTNFGQVTSGQNVADGIKIGDKIKSIRVE